MPFVATLAVTAGCTRSSDTINPLPPPTNTATPKPPPEPTTSSSAGELVYDGYGGCYRMVDGEKKYVPQCPDALLPEPPNDQLVYKHGAVCNRVPDGRTVRCPPGGPTAIVPEPSSIKVAGGSIGLRYGSLDCHRYEDMHCPPSVACNPPPPEPVTCPKELMPKLAAGVKPTKRDGTRCWFGAVEVTCP